MQFHHFWIGEEIHIKDNNIALIIHFELCSIRCANLYIDVRSSSANVGIPLERNILLALYGLQIPRRYIIYVAYVKPCGGEDIIRVKTID